MIDVTDAVIISTLGSFVMPTMLPHLQQVHSYLYEKLFVQHNIMLLPRSTYFIFLRISYKNEKNKNQLTQYEVIIFYKFFLNPALTGIFFFCIPRKRDAQQHIQNQWVSPDSHSTLTVKNYTWVTLSSNCELIYAQERDVRISLSVTMCMDIIPSLWTTPLSLQVFRLWKGTTIILPRYFTGIEASTWNLTSWWFNVRYHTWS